MFGNPGGAAAADLSIEAFEDDVKVAGRQVSHPPLIFSPSPTIRARCLLLN